METIEFETEVEDIKTSKVNDDTCPMKGELHHHGRDVKFKVTASADNKDILEELFGGVGRTVTFRIVENAQTSLLDE